MNEEFDRLLNNIEKEARERVAAGKDVGHTTLVAHCESLLDLAKKFEFHDFLNTNFATPKVHLVGILEVMAQEAKDGKYDN